MIYLIQYDRKQGQLVSLDSFPAQSKQSAEEARLRMELPLVGNHDTYEVVLLEAKNEQELRKTHRRYFERLDQLLADSTAAVD
jgi:thioesterase domain-containing protein